MHSLPTTSYHLHDSKDIRYCVTEEHESIFALSLNMRSDKAMMNINGLGEIESECRCDTFRAKVRTLIQGVALQGVHGCPYDGKLCLQLPRTLLCYIDSTLIKYTQSRLYAGCGGEAHHQP